MAASKTIQIIAKAVWAIPALLLFLGINQVRVAQDIRSTLERGTSARAEITDWHLDERADVKFDYVSLRVPLASGDVLVREKMPMPHSLIYLLEGKEEVDVRVREGAAQELVIEEVGATQWRIAAMNAAISFFTVLMAGGAIFLWNRHLKREA